MYKYLIYKNKCKQIIGGSCGGVAIDSKLIASIPKSDSITKSSQLPEQNYLKMRFLPILSKDNPLIVEGQDLRDFLRNEIKLESGLKSLVNSYLRLVRFLKFNF